MNQFIAAKNDPQLARSYWTMGRSDSDRAFRAARRHSRHVRVMRIAVPVVMIIGFVIISLLTFFNPLRMLTKLPINIDSLVVSGTRVTMEHPHLSGFTKDGRAYEVTAQAAAQDVTKPDLIELHSIDATLHMQDKTTMNLTAIDGTYDSKGELLRLQKKIVLTSSTGYKGRLQEALVDIRKGHVVSEKPVEVELLQGTLNSNRLEVINSGEQVIFGGGVDMTLMLKEGDMPTNYFNQNQQSAPSAAAPKAKAR